MSFVGEVLATVARAMVGVSVNATADGALGVHIAVGFAELPIVKMDLVSYRGYSKVYLRTASDNIYMLWKSYDDEGNDVIALVDGRRSSKERYVSYTLTEEERKNSVIKLGEPLYLGAGHTSEIVEIIALSSHTSSDFMRITGGRKNSIGNDFKELLEKV